MNTKISRFFLYSLRYMWKPTADLETLKQRAEILQTIRQFFQARNMLEVETPCLSSSTITDPYLESIEVPYGGETLYLQTSPEYHMKRLLAAGSGDIFQICKSFRQDESGRLHNPEFLMLEWYRLDFDDIQLMDEIEALLKAVLSSPCQGGARGGFASLKESPAHRLSYTDAFKKYLNLDIESEVSTFQDCAVSHQFHSPDWGTDRDAWLLYLFSEGIEPHLQHPTFIYDFPASQASLARLKENGRAARFELYASGVELANGFSELQNPQEQQKRFEENQTLRAQKNLAERPIDRLFLEALDAGLPDCAGVALGLDRLIMLALGKQSIADVMSFII